MSTIDCTPGAHSHTEALAVISFTLACGCRTRVSDPPDRAIEHKRVGCEYPCTKHGDQVITRATQRLRGWQPAW